MTDTSPAAVAQIIAAPWCYGSEDIADTLRAVDAERDALAGALVTMGINPASVIATMKGAQDE